LLLNRWIEGRHYDHEFANKLFDLASELLPQSGAWRRLHKALAPIKDDNLPAWYRRWDYTLLQVYESFLEPHARTVWHYLKAMQVGVYYIRDEEGLKRSNHYIALLADAQALDAAWPPIREALGVAFASRGNFYANQEPGLALAEYEQSLRLRPDDAFTLRNAGASLYDLGNYRDALTYYERSLALRPDNAWTLGRRGAAKARLEDYSGALVDYDRSLELDPDDAWTLARRGAAKARLEDYSGALVDYDRSLEIEPGKVVVIGERAVIKLRLGDQAGAAAGLDHALDSFDLNNVEHRLGIVLINILKAQYGDALQTLNDLLQNGDGHQQALDVADGMRLRAALTLILGDEAGALADYAEALQSDPDADHPFYVVFEVFVAQHKIDEALTWLERAVALDSRYREKARADSDYAHLRADPRFVALVGEL
jgi:tetratricopeptide (TPR) repeat protein